MYPSRILRVILLMLILAGGARLQAVQPTITSLQDLFIVEDSPSDELAFTVADAETPASQLVVSAVSSDQSIVPNSGLIISGTTGNHTLKIFPATNAVGICTITVRVVDSEALFATTSFLLKIFNVNDPPSISITNAVVSGESGGYIRNDITLSDPDGVDNLALIPQSLNQNLVTDLDIYFTGSGANRTVIVHPAAGKTGAARIQITVSDPEGLNASAFFDVVVTGTQPKPPVITANPVNQTAPLGGNVTFAVGATGDGPLSYQWRFENEIIANATGAELTLTNVSALNAGSYTVAVSNTAGTVTSTPAILTLVVPPTILTQPLSQTVIVGGNALLLVEAGGEPPFGYQWYFNETNLIADAVAPFLDLQFLQFTNSGNYTVVVNNGSGSVTSQVAVLNVVPRPNLAPSVAIASPSGGTKFIAPRNLRIAANASDFDGQVVKVDFYDGATLLGAVTAPPFNFTYTNAAAGTHTLMAVATDDQGATNSSVSVTVTGVSDFGTQPGSLDGNLLGFGADGTVQTVAVQANGKIVIGGAFDAVNELPRSNLTRLNTDGSLDLTFNAALTADNTVNSLVVRPSDGKLIVAGGFAHIGGVGRNAVARLSADGTVDTFFNPGSGPDNQVYAVALQADGKILIGGSFANVNNVPRGGIARLNEDGSLDTIFNVPGGIGGGVFTRVNAILVSADGKIIVGGDFTTAGGVAANAIVRLGENGGVDSSFLSGAGANNAINAIAAQTDGKIIIAGTFTQYNGTARAGIARLNADGSLDASFDPGAGASGINTVLAQSNGKVFVGGSFKTFNGAERNGVARLNADGTLDSTFDAGSGVAGGFVPRVLASALQSDGKILIGGDFSVVNGVSVNNLARLNGDSIIITERTPAHFKALTTTSTQVELTIEGKAGQTYLIQSSTDLTAWIEVKTATPATDTFSVIDTIPAGSQRRFYRAITQ